MFYHNNELGSTMPAAACKAQLRQKKQNSGSATPCLDPRLLSLSLVEINGSFYIRAQPHSCSAVTHWLIFLSHTIHNHCDLWITIMFPDDHLYLVHPLWWWKTTSFRNIKNMTDLYAWKFSLICVCELYLETILVMSNNIKNFIWT